MAGQTPSKPTANTKPKRSDIVFRIVVLTTIPIVLAITFVFIGNSLSVSKGINGVLVSPPRPTWGYVTDEYTGAFVVSATVTYGDRLVETDKDGEYNIGVVPQGASLSYSAPGYEPVTATVGSESNVSVPLRPSTFAGRLIDSVTGKPVDGATVFRNSETITSTLSGTFQLNNVPKDFKLKVMAPGYKKQEVEIFKQKAQDLKLEPFAVKGLYFSFYATGWDERREQLLNLIDKTELNAVIFDVKGDYGYISYPSQVPLVKQIGAEKIMIKDMDAMVASLKKRGIYTIARIVVFKDNELASARPDLAIKTRSGVYVDTEGLRWVDPYRKEVWDYNITLAEEVARKGFDEVNFDYVRFPSDGTISGNLYAQPFNEETRMAALSGFLAAARARLKPLGVFTSADVFGWTMFRDDDMGLGQQIEHLGPSVDYLCPMVYPSTWGPGSKGVSDPVAKPYDIVFLSTKGGIDRLKTVPTVRIRPWLQDFDDYGPSKKHYGAEEINAQKKAATDAGATGWMFWNAGAVYTEGGYAPKPH